MKNALLLLFLFTCTLSAQSYNDFEFNNGLDIQIGLNNSDSIWQIGPPQKTILDSAFSQPNVIITDTINPYPINLTSSFIVYLKPWNIWDFPFIQLEWMQKTDLEDGVDGGVVETSYDNGQTWSNIFDDTLYRPDVVGTYQWDSLHNGQAGFTGNSDWSWVAICWGTAIGTVPDAVSEIQVRFTLLSDSVDTNQEGWMMDNFTSYGGGIIGSVPNQAHLKPISIYPNPAKEKVYIDLTDIRSNDALIEILDASGTKLLSQEIQINGASNYSLDVNDFSRGVYFLLVKTNESMFYQKFLKLD